MTTIQRVLGCENPTNESVVEEFQNRKLNLKCFEIITSEVVNGQRKYTVHGMSQTISDKAEIALMKAMIVYDANDNPHVPENFKL